MAGNLRYRDGAWRLTVYAGRRPDGRQHRIHATVHGADNRTGRREAERALAALVAQVDAGQHQPTRAHTVDQLLDAWLAQRSGHLAATTHATYTSCADLHIRPALGPTRVDKLRPSHLNRLYDQLTGQGLAPKTVRHVHGTISAALGYAVRWQWVAANVAERAGPPAARRPAIVVPTVAQVDAVIAAGPPDMAALVRVAATTGHRRGSLLALRWTDLDLERGSATFARAVAAVKGQLIEKATKADRVDTVTIGPATASVLTAMRHRHAETALACGAALSASAFLWPQDPAGLRPWHPGGVGARWRAACRRAGVTGVRFHDLKHFAASVMLSEGVPMHIVSQRTGTSAATLERVYAHFIPGADAEAAVIMDRLLG